MLSKVWRKAFSLLFFLIVVFIANNFSFIWFIIKYYLIYLKHIEIRKEKLI